MSHSFARIAHKKSRNSTHRLMSAVSKLWAPVPTVPKADNPAVSERLVPVSFGLGGMIAAMKARHQRELDLVLSVPEREVCDCGVPLDFAGECPACAAQF